MTLSAEGKRLSSWSYPTTPLYTRSDMIGIEKSITKMSDVVDLLNRIVTKFKSMSTVY